MRISATHPGSELRGRTGIVALQPGGVASVRAALARFHGRRDKLEADADAEALRAAPTPPIEHPAATGGSALHAPLQEPRNSTLPKAINT